MAKRRLKERKLPRAHLAYWRMNEKDILFTRLVDEIKRCGSMDQQDKVFVLNMVRHKVLEGKI